MISTLRQLFADKTHSFAVVPIHGFLGLRLLTLTIHRLSYHIMTMSGLLRQHPPHPLFPFAAKLLLLFPCLYIIFCRMNMFQGGREGGREGGRFFKVQMRLNHFTICTLHSVVVLNTC